MFRDGIANDMHAAAITHFLSQCILVSLIMCILSQRMLVTTIYTIIHNILLL